ncbi:MAG: MAPEG family protein, partial [Gammaproteobacteria bacterium]
VALVAAAQFAGISTPLTVLGCALYFWARLAHYIIYTFGIPGLRTLSFLIGVVGEVLIAITLIRAF